MNREVSGDEYASALTRLRERYPDLHFGANGAMHLSSLPCVVCDMETVDDGRRQSLRDDSDPVKCISD